MGSHTHARDELPQARRAASMVQGTTAKRAAAAPQPANRGDSHRLAMMNCIEDVDDYEFYRTAEVTTSSTGLHRSLQIHLHQLEKRAMYLYLTMCAID
ncbi:hypothetical protein E2562_003867 [Oryza meyeriana var. granulata]|uniref:Uncharacterized protein n=1 Tax=Oryza meyeriana var. granulata TaxID=110450 RepID=A0A6G1CYL6_9ORYZ|nr:hypothetical protein E2562_003867 [Oryza meyeriana var. granulata]